MSTTPPLFPNVLYDLYDQRYYQINDILVAGVPATITVANTTDSTAYVALFDSATGNLNPKTNDGITYNATTKQLTTEILSVGTATITGNTTIGSTSAGKNLTIEGTLGTELAPALTAANWTVGAGWAAVTGGVLQKNADGAGYATMTSPPTLTVGALYKLVVTISSMTVGSCYSYFSDYQYDTISSASTKTTYFVATTTDAPYFYPGTASRFTISAVSLKQVTYGSLTSSDITLRGKLTDANGGSTYIKLNDDGYALEVHTKGITEYTAGFFSTNWSTEVPIFEYFGWGVDSGIFASGEFGIGTPTAEKLYFYTNGYSNNRLTIDGSGNVGIGTHSPSTPLYVVGADNSTAVTVKINAATANINASDTFISFESTDGSIGSISGGTTVSFVCYNTFTGSHYTQIDDKTGLDFYLVLCSTGEKLDEFTEKKGLVEEEYFESTSSDKGKTVPEKKTKIVEKTYKASTNKHLVKSKICSKEKDKSVYGVYGGTDKEGRDIVLALGTGCIYVANKGKNIEVGDYLTSSDIKGLSQLQSDDTLHSYTIAKASESIIWNVGETKRLISCTYHCG